MVEEAIKAKNAAPVWDSFWAAYDLEDISLENKRKAHVEAYRLAEANGIHIALSSISIEVWILLHFTSKPGRYLQSDSAVRALRKYFPNYMKGSVNVVNTLQHLIADARRNAVNLLHHLERDYTDKKPYELNPYTSFHLLLDAIDLME